MIQRVKPACENWHEGGNELRCVQNVLKVRVEYRNRGHVDDGRFNLVIPAACAAVAVGADGLLVEFHPDPASALSDGEQSLPITLLPEFVEQVGKVATAVGRYLG
jgi:3-deoxy-D-manno-octulosonic acid (KDO) 8-phosphate synthase